ncbi:hypothetical protein [Chlamydiifrater volucris]|uniref:hypothetical protein n=1 Tax=Chlamydiifrater volucris TaxID=2681470 RepID=UPI001BCF221E|nr:hypothetical protein [Chlamydiifrater volucris]
MVSPIPTPGGIPPPLEPQVVVTQPGGASGSDEGAGPSSETQEGASGGAPSVSTVRHEYSFQFGLLEASFVDLARQVFELMDSIASSPRVVEGARACHDQMAPWCESKCGCPSCGCPDGQCGCGSFGRFLCNCFAACCIPGRRQEEESDDFAFFRRLEELYGPIALGLAFNSLGLDMTSVVKGEVQLTDTDKRNLEAEAARDQNKLARLGLQRNGKNIRESLVKVHQGEKEDLKQNVLGGLLQLLELPPTEEDTKKSLYVDFGGGSSGSPPALSEKDLTDLLCRIYVYDLTINRIGGMGIKDACLAARAIWCLLTRWFGSSVPGVRVCIDLDLLNTVIGIVLLVLGYVPGERGEMSQELVAQLLQFRSSLRVDENSLRESLRSSREQHPSIEEGEEESGDEEGAVGGRDEPDAPLSASGRSSQGPLSAKGFGANFGSVEHQRSLVEAVRRVQKVSTVCRALGATLPVVAQPGPTRPGSSASGDSSPSTSGVSGEEGKGKKTSRKGGTSGPKESATVETSL